MFRDRGLVFIGSHSHLFSAVDFKSGREVWTVELPDRIESSACCDPAGHHVFVGCYDGKLYCLESRNGAIEWHFPTGDMVKSSPCWAGSYVVFGSYDRHLYCLVASNGSLHWKRRISTSGSIFASPAWDGEDRILAATLDGTCACVSLSSGHLLWSSNLANPVFASPVWTNDKLRCLMASVDGLVRCTTSNGEVLWQFRASGNIFSTPAVTEDRLLFGSHDHLLYCLALADGSLLWRVPFNSPVKSSPYLYNDLVTCSDTIGTLRVLDLRGGVVAETKLDGEVFSSPVMLEDRLVIGCRDENLYCYKFSMR